MAQQPAPLERRTAVNATVGQTNFQTSLTAQAALPTVLGEMGSRLAISASTQMAKQLGTQSGNTPHGDLLPPVTDFDKYYSSAYSAQAQTTLGLQASKLLTDSQNEMSKSWRLTPEMIEEYRKNVSEGLGQILENAPTDLKPSMGASFGQAVISSTGDYERKMIAQQKKDYLEQSSIYMTNQQAAMYEAARTGNMDGAFRTYQDLEGYVDRLADGGIISRLQAEASKKANKISLYSGDYTAGALAAWKSGKMDDYLANMLSARPENFTTQEWESVAANVLKEVQFAESLQRRNEDAMYSEGRRLLAEGLLTPEFVADLQESSTSKTRFNDFMAQVATWNRKSQRDTNQASMVDWENTDSMAFSSEDAKKKRLFEIAEARQEQARNNGVDLSQFEAMTEAMQVAGAPVKAYTEVLNQGFLSGNGDLMLRNLKAYDALRRTNSNVLLGMSDKAIAAKTKFERELNNGFPVEIAAANVGQLMTPMSKDEQEVVQQQKQKFLQKYSDPAKKISWASDFIDSGNNRNIFNSPAFAQKTANMYLENLEVFKGDEESARQKTQEAINMTYGTTAINGIQQDVYMPVEKIANLGVEAAPVFYEDLANSIKEQLKPMQEAFNASKSAGDARTTSYYRIVERPTLEQYKDALNKINTYNQTSIKEKVAASRDETFKAAQDVVNRYMAPVEIEQVFASGEPLRLTVNIQAYPGVTVSSNGMIGDYNVMGITKDGKARILTGMFSGGAELFYRPNINQVRQRYAEYAAADPNEINRVYQKLVEKKKLKDEGVPMGLEERIAAYYKGGF